MCAERVDVGLELGVAHPFQAMARRLLLGSQPVEEASEGSARFVASLTAVVRVGDVEGSLIDRGKSMCASGAVGCLGMARSDTAASSMAVMAPSP